MRLFVFSLLRAWLTGRLPWLAFFGLLAFRFIHRVIIKFCSILGTALAADSGFPARASHEQETGDGEVASFAVEGQSVPPPRPATNEKKDRLCLAKPTRRPSPSRANMPTASKTLDHDDSRV